jgi:O-antigen ligase
VGHLNNLRLDVWPALTEANTNTLILLCCSSALILVSTLAILYLPAAFSLTFPLALLAAVVVTRWPMESLIGFFFARMTVDILWWMPAGLGLNFMEAFTGAITILLVVLCIRDMEAIVSHRFFPLVVLWTILLLVAAVQQPEFRVVAELLARFQSPVMIMLLVSIHFQSAASRRLLMGGLLAGGVLPIALGIFSWVTGQAVTFELSGYERLAGAYSNIADHGLSMSTFATIGLFWLWQRGFNWKSVFLAGYMGLALLLLALTYTRTPLTGLALFVPVFLYLQGARKILGFFVLSVIVLLATNSVLQDRFSDIANVFTADAGMQFDRLGSGRLGIWRRSVEAYFDQPFLHILLGNGLNSQYSLAGEGQDSHGDYLSMLFQIGPFGLILWMWFQVETTVRGLKELRFATHPATRSLLVFAVAMAASVFACNTLSNAYMSRVTMSWIWWGVVGLVYAIHAERTAPLERVSEAT